MNQGWQCPVCGRVNAPQVLECPCQTAERVQETRPPWQDPYPDAVPFGPVVPSRTSDPRPGTWTLWCGRPVVQESKVAFE